MDFNSFSKIAEECGRFGQIIVAKGFKKLPKVRKITQSGHTGHHQQNQIAKGTVLFELCRECSTSQWH